MKNLLLLLILVLAPAGALAQSAKYKPYVGEHGSKLRSDYGVGLSNEFWWDELMTCSIHVGAIGEWLADKDKGASEQFMRGAAYIGAAAVKRAVLDSGMNETIAMQIVVGPFATLAVTEMNVLVAEAEAKGTIDRLVQGELARCDSLVAQYINEFPNDLPSQ